MAASRKSKTTSSKESQRVIVTGLTEVNREQLSTILPLKLQGAAVKVYDVFTRLGDAERRVVEDLLLIHAFLPKGTDPYLNCAPRRAAIERRCFIYLLKQNASNEMAEAWSSWADELSTKPMTRAAIRKMLLQMISNFVHRRYLEGWPAAGTVSLRKHR